MQKQPMFKNGRVEYATITVARMFLGLAMMPYAIDKLLAYQFKVPAWNYAQPLGATAGHTLVWATYGYSPLLQMLLGLFELVPALLLLNVARPGVSAPSSCSRFYSTSSSSTLLSI